MAATVLGLVGTFHYHSLSTDNADTDSLFHLYVDSATHWCSNANTNSYSYSCEDANGRGHPISGAHSDTNL